MSAVRWPLVWELARKDLQEVIRARQLFFPLLVMPVFLTGDMLLVFTVTLNSRSPPGAGAGTSFITFAEVLLFVPILLPTILGAPAVVMEKTNRTLEPLLSTPLTDTELLLAKSLAPLLPAFALTGGAYAAYSSGALLFVHAHYPAVSLPWPSLLVVALLLAPLVGLLSTFVAIAVSTKAKEVRAAQQVATLVVLPILLLVVVVGIALGPGLLGELVLGAVLAVLAFGVLRFTVARFHRDQILVAGV